MPESLDIHPASHSERVAMYRNTYEIWGKPGTTIEEHVDARMNSPQHNRARRYVGCLGGQPVCGLAAYPARFRIRGKVFAGIEIGSVHTVPRCRRQGYAARLMNWVEEHEIGLGAKVSLLYSDIAPAYYERLGYRLCPCWQGFRNPSEESRLNNADQLTYTSVQPRDVQLEIESLYRASHEAAPISIQRDSEYWDYVFRKGAGDDFGLIHEADGTLAAYVQLRPSGVIADWATAEITDETFDRVFSAVIREAQRRGLKTVGGWFPDVPAARRMFALTERTRELTMLKALHGDVRLDADLLASAQHFREIDHV